MSRSGAEFLDTNVLIYAFSTDHRSKRAEELLARRCAVSIQGLNEFANVARRKLEMSWGDIGEAIESIRLLCPSILPLDVETHGTALQLAARYRLSFYDALMIAAALKGGCETLWSEDMHDGLVIEDRMQIINPFST